MKRTWILFGAFLITLISGCGGDDHSTAVSQADPVPVTAVRIATEQVGGRELFSGTVEPLEKVRLSTRISGWVNNIYVEEGQAVEKGQLLVTLRSNDLKAKYSQAEAAIAEASVHYTNAQTNLRRLESLFGKGAATRKELDDMRSAFASAEARRKTALELKKEADEMLSYSSLAAPFNGVVTRRMVEQGDLASPGQLIMEVENVRQMKIAARVPETRVADLKTGMKAVVILTGHGAANAVINGTIDQINPSADPISRQFEVKVLVDNEERRLKSGMFARVSVGDSRQSSLLVPRSALFKRGQLEGVFVVDAQKKARLRWVRTGASFEERIEILSGLNPDEIVVTDKTGQLLDGQAVEVKL